MQLKSVVLPAPLGPIRPTISHSSTLSETSSSACRPPKRIDTLSSSSTDIATACVRFMCLVVHGETVPGQPSTDRSNDLADAARVHDECLQKQHRADEAGHIVLVVDVPTAAVDGVEEPVEERVQQAEESRRDDDAGARAQAADD